MAVKEALKSAGKNLLGNTDKAMIILHEASSSVMSGEASEQLGAIESALGKAAAAGGGLNAQSVNMASATGDLGAAWVLHVQYNPSSLALNANARSMQVKHLQSHVVEGIPNTVTVPPSVLLQVDLVFDAVNNKDAFMAEKFRFSASDIASVGAGIAMAYEKKVFSVQSQTNGLLCALMRNNTRIATFRWADMSFTGEVSEVSARYTMFSVSGHPIRSVVTLKMTQQVHERSDIEYWDKAFDKCFSKNEASGVNGGVRVGQKVGNLLNIGY